MAYLCGLFINRLNKIEVAAGQLKSQAAAASDELHDTQRHLKRLKTPSTGPAAALVASVALNIAGKVVGMNAGEDAVAAVSRFKDTQDVSNSWYQLTSICYAITTWQGH